MKPSETYYQNRRLLKQLTYDKKKFRPTVDDCDEWFAILNEQIFGNKLTRPSKFNIIRSSKFSHAFYTYYSKKSSKYPQSEITVTKVYKCKKFFVEVLAHEMIHHFQYLHNEPVGHGPSFHAWDPHFKLRGLLLNRIYDR